MNATTLDATPAPADQSATGTNPAATTSSEWDIPEHRLAAFKDKIAAANKRLARTGIDARFEATYHQYDKAETINGHTITRPYVLCTLNEFRLTIGNYTFMAALIAEEAGYVVACAPGQSLHGWTRPNHEEATCQHCNTARPRTRLYVVRNDDTGIITQLGHTCIALYTGINPKGLWALTFAEDLNDFANKSDEDEDAAADAQFFAVGRGYGADISTVLALAYALTNGGIAYISTARAAETDRTSTASAVRHQLFSKRTYMSCEQLTRMEAIDTEAATVRNNTELMTSIRAAAQTINTATDYGQNMHVILQGEYVSSRSIGTLASLVAVYARAKADEVERQARPTPNTPHLADEGTKLTDLQLTVKTIRQRDNHYGTSTYVTGYAPTGHLIGWKASKALDYEPGTTLNIKTAIVKEHTEYQGTPQTVITRARIAQTEN